MQPRAGSARPRMFPPTVFADPTPQPRDLGGKEAMARLPPAAVAPLAPVRLYPLGAGHSLVEGGSDGGVPRELLAAATRQSGLPR